MEYLTICWLWLLGSLVVLVTALAFLRNGLTQALLVGGALLNAAGSLSNGLVVAYNDQRMPVEPESELSEPMVLFDGWNARHSRLCRFLVTVDDAAIPSFDGSVRLQLPSQPSKEEKVIGTPGPKLAFLDNRHPVRVCGRQGTHSTGDIFIGLGWVLLVPGIALLALGGLWQLWLLLFRKRKAPA